MVNAVGLEPAAVRLVGSTPTGATLPNTSLQFWFPVVAGLGTVSITEKMQGYRVTLMGLDRFADTSKSTVMDTKS